MGRPLLAQSGSSARRWLQAAVLAALAFSPPAAAGAEVISGVIDEWPESGTDLVLGDGVNSVRISWSLSFYDSGYFYGRSDGVLGAAEVAELPDVTDVSEITDASAFDFVSYPPDSVGPLCDAACDPDQVGDFVVWRNTATGHVLVLRIDDIRVDDLAQSIAFLDGTWWFQTDGSADFSSVPEPRAEALFAIGLGMLALCAFANGRGGRSATRAHAASASSRGSSPA